MLHLSRIGWGALSLVSDVYLWSVLIKYPVLIHLSFWHMIAFVWGYISDVFSFCGVMFFKPDVYFTSRRLMLGYKHSKTKYCKRQCNILGYGCQNEIISGLQTIVLLFSNTCHLLEWRHHCVRVWWMECAVCTAPFWQFLIQSENFYYCKWNMQSFPTWLILMAYQASLMQTSSIKICHRPH